MVIQLQTSFIQKKPQGLSSGAPLRGGKSVNLFAAVAIVIFLLTAALAAGVFFYRAHLIRTIAASDAKLAAAKKSLEPEFINEASRLHSRIEAVKELFALHYAPSALFDLLEKKTLESVRFRNFSLDARNDRAVTLSMTGEAKSFNAVALQSDVFGAEPQFVDPVFSNFNLNERGDVVFNFKTTLDSARLRYRETVIANAPAESESFGEEDAGEPFE